MVKRGLFCLLIILSLIGCNKDPIPECENLCPVSSGEFVVKNIFFPNNFELFLSDPNGEVLLHHPAGEPFDSLVLDYYSPCGLDLTAMLIEEDRFYMNTYRGIQSGYKLYPFQEENCMDSLPEPGGDVTVIMDARLIINDIDPLEYISFDESRFKVYYDSLERQLSLDFSLNFSNIVSILTLKTESSDEYYSYELNSNNFSTSNNLVLHEIDFNMMEKVNMVQISPPSFSEISNTVFAYESTRRLLLIEKKIPPGQPVLVPEFSNINYYNIQLGVTRNNQSTNYYGLFEPPLQEREFISNLLTYLNMKKDGFVLDIKQDFNYIKNDFRFNHLNTFSFWIIHQTDNSSLAYKFPQIPSTLLENHPFIEKAINNPDHALTTVINKENGNLEEVFQSGFQISDNCSGRWRSFYIYSF